MLRAAFALLVACALLAGLTLASNYPGDAHADNVVGDVETYVVRRVTTISYRRDGDAADTLLSGDYLFLPVSYDTAMPGEQPGEAETQFTRPASMEEICATLASLAMEHELPLPFFVRLIWQESRFRAGAVSRAGARGIAQFMPGTADWRGLEDPHDPIQSLHKSADYLRELRDQFGNLGLAAAAYNGGSGRVQAWLNGRGRLPKETRQYVRIVTGMPAEQWRDRQDASAVQTERIPQQVPCPALVAMTAAQAQAQAAAEPVRSTATDDAGAGRSEDSGWFVVMGINATRAKAQAQSERLQQKFQAVLKGREPSIVSGRIPGRGPARMSVVRIAERDRASATRLCAQLRAGGASCAVIHAS